MVAVRVYKPGRKYQAPRIDYLLPFDGFNVANFNDAVTVDAYRAMNRHRR